MQKSIIEHYPPVLQKIKEIQQIAKAEDLEFEKLGLSAAKVLQNMFLSTATEEGVARFESMLGIAAEAGQSLEKRKEHIHYMTNRRKMSLSELENMLAGYSKSVELMPDYNRQELEILVGEWVDSLKMIYHVSDEILPLQIYIFFSMELLVELSVKTEKGTFTFETENRWWDTWKLEPQADMKTEIQGEETFSDVRADISKDLWRLDGGQRLDGSRILDAQLREEEL